MTRRKPPRPKPDRAVFQRKKPRNRWMLNRTPIVGLE